jgi:uncharacterized membrane protein YccC
MTTTDLIRADWYTRTADLMSAATIDANRRDLVAQLQPEFTWNSGRPLTDAERADTLRCLDVLDAETRRRGSS